MKNLNTLVRIRVVVSLLMAFAFLSEGPVQANHVVINEIHYNPDVKTEQIEFVELYNPGPEDVNLTGWTFSDGTNNDDYEFIELTNISDQTLDLTHVSFEDGISFESSDSHVTSLGPGQFVLVVADITAFEARYGPALRPLIAGQYQGKLANSGEHVKLIDTWDGTLAEFDYDDSPDWPALADGLGHSLVPLASALPNQHQGSLNDATNWQASTHTEGSPGAP